MIGAQAAAATSKIHRQSPDSDRRLLADDEDNSKKAFATVPFLSTDSNCETRSSFRPKGSATRVGYISIVKGGNFLRALRRCVAADSTPARIYSLNSVTCAPGYDVEAVLGYVR